MGREDERAQIAERLRQRDYRSLIRSRRGRGVLNSLLRYYALPGKITLLRRFRAQFVRRGDLCFDLG